MQDAAFFRLDCDESYALFENNLDAEGPLFILHGLAGTISADAPDELPDAFEGLERARMSGHWLAIAVHYESGLALEPHLSAQFPQRGPLLRAWAFRKRIDIPASARDDWWVRSVNALTPQKRETGFLSLAPHWSEAKHAAAVRKILDYIHAGDCYQVNLTFPFKGQVYGHPAALFSRLRSMQPVRYGALIHDGAEWVLSRSPELFFSRQAARIVTKPMKGTIARTGDAAEDAARRERLRDSEKDRAENLMIVDLIRNDLGKLVPPGGVAVTSLFDIETYETVYQLTSTITAGPVGVSDRNAFEALFPCGSVTGAPKIRAMEIIHELETEPRGIYCGALGWIAPTGDQCFSVPIRTLIVSQNRGCRLNVGSGIVADSIPASEYQESLSKAVFASKLAEDISLIETMLWAPNEGIRLFNLHLSRLGDAANALGFTFDERRIREDVATITANLASAPHRVRLLLSRKGDIHLETAPLPPLPQTPRILISPTLLDERDPKLQFKTTARRFYNTALQEAIEADCFDMLFFNRHGELCEGARSNVYLQISGALLTPARTCGLLPGVFRQHLLSESIVREAVLSKEDLLSADRIFLSNALRGLFEVRLEG